MADVDTSVIDQARGADYRCLEPMTRPFVSRMRIIDLMGVSLIGRR